MLETQLKEVEAKIQAACDRAGRKREEVTLIAVSKTKPIEMLQEAYDLGVRVFGENKVQEITAKYDALPDDIAMALDKTAEAVESTDTQIANQFSM